MIRELQESVDLFSAADRVLDRVGEPLRCRLGLTSDWITAQIEAILAKGGHDGSPAMKRTKPAMFSSELVHVTSGHPPW